MDMYQHDRADMFQFVLRGELIGDRVQDLEHAWNTAKSVLAGKELAVELSGLTNADRPGVDLLCRMRESGARLTVAQPPANVDLICSMGIPAPAPGRRQSDRAVGLLRRFRTLRAMILSGGARPGKTRRWAQSGLPRVVGRGWPVGQEGNSGLPD